MTSSPTPTPNCKFIAHVPAAATLVAAAGLSEPVDNGYSASSATGHATGGDASPPEALGIRPAMPDEPHGRRT